MSRELSKKNKYYIPLYRRKELEYYCRQYDDYVDWLRTCQNFIPPMTDGYFNVSIQKSTKPDLSDFVIAGMKKRAKIQRRVDQIHEGLYRIKCLHNADIYEQVVHGRQSDGTPKMRIAIQHFYWYLDQQESYL